MALDSADELSKLTSKPEGTNLIISVLVVSQHIVTLII